MTMNKAAIRRDLQYRADEQLVRNLLKLLRRERIEAIVLKYINGMREIVGAKPVESIWAACAFFRDHELRLSRQFAYVRPEPMSLWLARQIRAVVMFAAPIKQSASSASYIRAKNGAWTAQWNFTAWQAEMLEEVNALEAVARKAMRW